MKHAVKYLLFLAGCIGSYLEPVKPLFFAVILLFTADFITGVVKSRKHSGRWQLRSGRLRWSFVKMFIYMSVMALTFAICELVQIGADIAVSAVKIEVWCIIYIEGLSIIENLLALFPEDRFLRFLRFLLAVEFLKYIPLLSAFLKENEDGPH